MRDRISAEVSQAAVSQAEVVAATAGDTSDPAALAVTAARQVRGRVLILDARGVVVADSSPGGVGADYGSRPEVASALGGKIAQDERESSTLDEPILATAVPVLRDGRPDGAVRITQSVDAVDRAVSSATLGLVAVGGIVLLLGLGAGVFLAASVVRPLRRLAGRRAASGRG